jgi:hypothetical protein
MKDLPQHLMEEQRSLEAEIRDAFKGVSREGGVSWNETKVLDDRGSDEEAKAARATDTDQDWTELADSTWDVGPGFGGFAFLDAIGFRYYLPAAMIRTLHDGVHAGHCWGIDGTLTLHKGNKPTAQAMREHMLSQWSLLDDRQRRAVARFLAFMVAWSEAIENWVEMKYWQRAHESYWNAIA